MSQYLELAIVKNIAMWITGVTALVVAIYTAFLFGQAKGRDFWQSPTLALHMLVHSFMAGAAALALIASVTDASIAWKDFLSMVMMIGIGVNLLTMLVELTMTHPTVDSHTVAHMITKGRYATKFYVGVLLVGNLLPLSLLLFVGTPLAFVGAGVAVLVGIYFTEQIWVEAPQRIALS